MKDNTNNRDDGYRNLDDMFRQGLETLRPEPSKDLWKGINRKLWWDEISHFTFTNLSKALWIGGIAGMMMIISALMVVVVPQTKISEYNSFMIINDPVSFGSNALYSPDSYSSDHAVATSFSGTGSAHSLKQAPQGLVSSTDELSSTNPEKELPINNQEDKDLASFPEDSHSILVNAGRSGMTEDPFTMTSIRASDIFGHDNEAGSASMITGQIMNIPNGKPPVPQFFSFDFGVTPAVTMNGNVSSEKEMNFSSNLGIAYHLGRFSLRTGVGVSYFADDGIYRIDYVSKDSVGFYNMVTSVAINQQDPKEIIYYTHRIVVYDSLEHIADDQTRNRYTYLQIPILAGFRLYETTRFGLTLQAGPTVSFLIREKEAEPVIDYPNARIIRIDKNTPARIKTTWQVWLGMRMDYRINKNFSLFAEPVYRYYFKPVVEQESKNAQKPYSIGLGLGIEYNFGRK